MYPDTAGVEAQAEGFRNRDPLAQGESTRDLGLLLDGYQVSGQKRDDLRYTL